jgi:nucleoside-diphosphate-sugar epimerase
LPIFENALAGKPMQWLVRTDIPHQLVYIRDAGELFVRLAELEGLSAYEVFNFGGITVKSVKDWFKDIAKIAGVRPRVKALPKFAISLLSPFVPIMREIKEMAYLFENSILLNDDKLKQRLPDFKPTDMDITIRETLDWFKNHLA